MINIMSVFFLMILFVILSPGMFLSIPPVGSRWWMTGKMSLRAVFVHAVVFAVILYVAQRMMLTEGFIAPIRGSASVLMRGPMPPPSMRGPVQSASMRGPAPVATKVAGSIATALRGIFPSFMGITRG